MTLFTIGLLAKRLRRRRPTNDSYTASGRCCISQTMQSHASLTTKPIKHTKHSIVSHSQCVAKIEPTLF